MDEFNPLEHNADDVKAHLKGATAEEFARVVGIEAARTDREPRVSVINYTQPVADGGVVGEDGYTRVVVDS